MYCKYCGTQLDKDGLCPNCGIVFESHPQVVYENLQTSHSEQNQKALKTSGMAVAGFVLAILSFFIAGIISDILGFLSLVFSIVGMSHTKNGAMRGRGFAVAGLWFNLIPFILGFLYGFVKAVR